MYAARGGSKGLQVLDLEASLESIAHGGPPGLAVAVKQIAGLLGAESALACGLADSESGPAFEGVFASGMEVAELRPAVEAFLREWLGVSSTIDPQLTDPRQRNVALTSDDMAALLGREIAPPREPMAQLGIAGLDVLAVLLCDGANALAWVGAMRRRPFTARDRALLQALVPALLERLARERRLAEAPVDVATLAAVLESVSGEAFLMLGDGNLLQANSEGRGLLARDPLGPASALREELAGHNPIGYSVTRVAAAGHPTHFLVVRRSAAADPGQRSEALGTRYRLTSRQRQVLAQLARGHCNKAIGASLGCSEGTVELHVSAILSKLGCSSRAETIARFWTEA